MTNLPDNSTNNESWLLLQVAKSDEIAFSSLYYLYHHRLGIYLYKLNFSKEFIEEIIQDVFCKVWESRRLLPEINNFQLWLLVVTKNHARNSLRKLVRERKEKQLWEKQQFGESGLFDITVEDRLQLIEEAIGQLPAQQKKVFILSRYKRLKYLEIAMELNISKETVKSYLKIANSFVRKYINSHLRLTLLWYWLFY